MHMLLLSALHVGVIGTTLATLLLAAPSKGSGDGAVSPLPPFRGGVELLPGGVGILLWRSRRRAAAGGEGGTGDDAAEGVGMSGESAAAALAAPLLPGAGEPPGEDDEGACVEGSGWVGEDLGGQ